MTKQQAATILRGMFPKGLNVRDLPPEGRQEMRDACDALLAAYGKKHRPTREQS